MSSKFESIVQSLIDNTPSGEVQEVYKDLKTITGDRADDVILDAIAQYNIKNFIPVRVDGKSVIISEFNKEGAKFFDPVSSSLFSVDHLNRVGLDVEPCQKTLSESQKSIYDDLKTYASKNFAGDVSYAVYSSGNAQDEVIIALVSTKYSPGNFWNGHWRSIYSYNPHTNNLKGTLDIDVHYFEDGNVAFKFHKDIEVQEAVNPIVAIKSQENEIEREMGSSFAALNERDFKSLRRRLPVTRSKINWGKGIGTYRLGKNTAESNLK